MFGDDHDSDQSISEEEDFGLSKSSNNYSFSLCDTRDIKEPSIQVLSQLEILRKDANELPCATTSSEKRPLGLRAEDEIEFPVFNNEDDSIHRPSMETMLDLDEEIDHCHGLAPIGNSDEKIISEEILNPDRFGNAKVDTRENTWCEVNREVEALVCLNENIGSYMSVRSLSKLNFFSKGGRRKVKPNLLFQYRSPEKAFPTVVSGANKISMSFCDGLRTEESHACANRDLQNSKTELLQVLNGRDAEKKEQSLLSSEGSYNDCNEHSVTELLECLQEKSGLQGNSEIHYRLKGKRTNAVINKNTSALGDRNMDDLLDVGSSSEDEDILPNPKSVLQQRTIADQFHEAFEAVSQKNFMPVLIFPRESRNGLSERMQHMMVKEKERDMDFLKKFGMHESSTDGSGFLDVKILSRSLEAKLNVCCCALFGDLENSQCLNYFQIRNQIGERILNIIFSSRLCSDVELEAGNLIRIYAPWMEINIKGKDEMIMLSTYFSQI